MWRHGTESSVQIGCDCVTAHSIVSSDPELRISLNSNSSRNTLIWISYYIRFQVRKLESQFGFLRPGIRLKTRFGVLRPGIRLGSQFGLLRPGIRIPGRKTYFKAAICSILASNPPPTPPHAGGGHGVGWVGYLRQGLSKLLFEVGFATRNSNSRSQKFEFRCMGWGEWGI